MRTFQVAMYNICTMKKIECDKDLPHDENGISFIDDATLVSFHLRVNGFNMQTTSEVAALTSVRILPP